MNIHFIQHEVFEAPGAYLIWAENNNHSIQFSKVYEYVPLPDSIDNIDCLIVMGGPQSPDTTTDECPYYNAPAEMALIKKCIDAGKIVIGVCLGAQLIGQALGAAYAHSPEKEIGNFPIELTAEGLLDQNINHFRIPLTVGHWHNDMPGLTTDSKVLAKSNGCTRQIIKYGENIYGFQCHMELTTEVARLLIHHEANLDEDSRLYKFVQSPADILDYDYTEMNESLYAFLNKITGGTDR